LRFPQEQKSTIQTERKLLHSPQWQTAIPLIDTLQKKVFLHELSSQVEQSLTFLVRGWGRDKLEVVVFSYPRVQPHVHKLTSFTQTETPKEVEVQTEFPKHQVSPVYSPDLQGTPELFQEVCLIEQVPLGFPLFEKSSQIPFVPHSLEK